MRFDTTGFVQEKIEVEDATREMVFGAGQSSVVAKNITVSRIVILGFYEPEALEIAKCYSELCAKQEHKSMTWHHLHSHMSRDDVRSSLEKQDAVFVLAPSWLEDASLRDVLRETSRVYFLMVHAVRIAMQLGLKGEEAEAFCRSAIAFEDMCLGCAHIMLPDGESVQETALKIQQDIACVWRKS